MKIVRNMDIVKQREDEIIQAVITEATSIAKLGQINGLITIKDTNGLDFNSIVDQISALTENTVNAEIPGIISNYMHFSIID